MENPFRPSFGRPPPELLDRTDLLEEFEYGLSLRSGALGLLTIVTGARGVGKTVMLNVAEDLAREQGWAVISDTATTGFLARIADSMRLINDELGTGPPARKITAIAGAGFGITTQLPPERQVDFRNLGEQLLRRLDDNKTGLLITVDEIQDAHREELLQLAATIQHFVREGLPIGFVCAGLPSAVSDLLNEGVATFLRRADRIDLHAVPIKKVESSYLKLFAAAGFTLSSETAKKAAAATTGYPFLVQLIGYFLWREAEKGGGTLTDVASERAITAGLKRNIRLVIAPAIAHASSRDMDYLQAMAQDQETSSTGEIARRMGAKLTLAANYRARLIDSGLIESVRHGEVKFSIPGLREYLRSTPLRS